MSLFFRNTTSSDLVHKSLWRLAEQETLFLMGQNKLTPQEVVRQYTGREPYKAELDDAVNAIYCFNLKEANKNGFVAY
jgi:hypothetical protein